MSCFHCSDHCIPLHVFSNLELVFGSFEDWWSLSRIRNRQINFSVVLRSQTCAIDSTDVQPVSRMGSCRNQVGLRYKNLSRVSVNPKKIPVVPGNYSISHHPEFPGIVISSHNRDNRNRGTLRISVFAQGYVVLSWVK